MLYNIVYHIISYHAILACVALPPRPHLGHGLHRGGRHGPHLFFEEDNWMALLPHSKLLRKFLRTWEFHPWTARNFDPKGVSLWALSLQNGRNAYSYIYIYIYIIYTYTYIYIYITIITYIYIYIYIIVWFSSARSSRLRTLRANQQSKNLESQGFDSSIILSLRVDFPGPQGVSQNSRLIYIYIYIYTYLYIYISFLSLRSADSRVPTPASCAPREPIHKLWIWNLRL